MADLSLIPEDPDLTRSILARTTGSPCGRLRALACDLVDGALAPDRAEVAQAHLDHCAACAALVAALRASAEALPRLADLDPGPWFAERVLRATARAPRPAFPARDAWSRLMRRPRIALEAAYIGAVAGFLGFNLGPVHLAGNWRAPAAVRPMAASARNLVQAERRTAKAVAGIFVAQEGRPPGAVQRLLVNLRPRPGTGEPSDTLPRPSSQTQD